MEAGWDRVAVKARWHERNRTKQSGRGGQGTELDCGESKLLVCRITLANLCASAFASSPSPTLHSSLLVLEAATGYSDRSRCTEPLDGISAHPGLVFRASVFASTQSTLIDGLETWKCGIVQLYGSAVQNKLPAE
jgi:hypothetical protein